MKNAEVYFLRGQNFFFFCAMTITVSFLPIYVYQIGLSAEEIGVIFAVGPFISIFSQPFWGVVADLKHSIRGTMRVLLCFSGMLILGIFLSRTFWLIFFFMSLFTFFNAAISPLNETRNIQAASQHKVSYGSIRGWGSLGFSMASLALGPIITMVGLPNMGYIYIGFLLLVYLCNRRVPDSAPMLARIQIRDIWVIMQDRKVYLFFVLVILISVPHRMNDYWFGIYLMKLGATEQAVGIAWMIAAGSEFFAFMFLYQFLERFSPISVLKVAALMYTIRWLFYSFSDSYVTLLVAQVMHAITFAFFFSASLRYIATVIPKDMLATGQGLFSAFFGGVSGIIGSLLGGWLIEKYSGARMYELAGFIALSGLCYAVLYQFFVVKVDKGMKQGHGRQQSSTSP